MQPMIRAVGLFLCLCGFIPTLSAQQVDAGLVTAVSGKAIIAGPATPARDISAFSKVREGERITLTGNSHLQIVYFASGTQEAWAGTGALEIGSDSSKPAGTELTVTRKKLPDVLVKQLAKTPSPDGTVRAGMVRMRSMSSVSRLTEAEKTYEESRAKTTAEDLTPDLFLLASYFELQAFDRLEARLGQLRTAQPDNAEIKALAGLYERAMRFARSNDRPQ